MVLPSVTMERPTVLPSPGTSTKAGNKTRNRPEWRDAVAGAGAGAFSRTVVAPIERVKLL